MNAPAPEKPIVAAFDFDGTLTRRDTLPVFLRQAAGWGSFTGNAIVLAPVLAGYALGAIRNDVAKQRVLTRFFSGMHIDILRDKAERFADGTLPGLLRAEAMRRFDWHKQQGHRCIVVSASLELYVGRWAKSRGFDDVLASRLETRADGRITGKLQGGNCFGREKVARLDALLGKRSGYTLYAYGDTRGDREMLSAADHAYYRHFPD